MAQPPEDNKKKLFRCCFCKDHFNIEDLERHENNVHGVSNCENEHIEVVICSPAEFKPKPKKSKDLEYQIQFDENGQRKDVKIDVTEEEHHSRPIRRCPQPQTETIRGMYSGLGDAQNNFNLELTASRTNSRRPNVAVKVSINQ